MTVEVLGAEKLTLENGVLSPLSLAGVAITASLEALDVMLLRAARKTTAATNVTRKTMRAMKTTRRVRENCGLSCFILLGEATYISGKRLLG